MKTREATRKAKIMITRKTFELDSDDIKEAIANWLNTEHDANVDGNDIKLVAKKSGGCDCVSAVASSEEY